MGDFNSLMVLMIICLSVPLVPAATIYTVGELSGWSMGGDYSSWASDKIFAVGDTLVFNYVPGHTVDEVTANDYKTCTTGNAVASDSSGATSITLKTAGSHYFICGIPGHCTAGMKLSVNVGGTGDSSPTTTATTSPSSTIATSPSSTTAISPSSTTAISPSSTAPSPATTTGGMTTTIGTLTHEPSSSITLSPFVALFFTIFVVMIKSFMVFY